MTHLQHASCSDGVAWALETALNRALLAKQFEASTLQTKRLVAMVVQLHVADDHLMRG